MNKNWENIKNTADHFGDNLDVSAAWERFEKRDDRKRKLFWLWPSLVFLLIVISSLLVFKHWNSTNTEMMSESSESEVVSIPTVNIEERRSLTHNQANSSITNLGAMTGQEILEHQTKLNTKRNINSKVITSPTKIIETKGKTNSFHKKSNHQPFNEYRTTNYFLTKNSNQASLLSTTQTDNISSTADDKFISAFDELIRTQRLINYKAKPFYISSNSYVPATAGIKNTWSKLSPSWAYGLSYSYGSPNRTIALEDLDFAVRRKDSEDFLNANSLDLSISRYINQHWSLSTGVSLDHYRSRTFEVTQELETDVLFEDVIVERQFQAGIVESVVDDVIGSRTIITERTRYQNYFNLSLPISINYHLNLSRKWSVILSSGMSYSILHKNDGSTFQSAFSVGEYEQVSNLQYRENGLLQGLAGLRFSYQMKEKLYLEGGLKARVDLNNRLIDHSVGSDKFRNYGLLIGLMKDI